MLTGALVVVIIISSLTYFFIQRKLNRRINELVEELSRSKALTAWLQRVTNTANIQASPQGLIWGDTGNFLTAREAGLYWAAIKQRDITLGIQEQFNKQHSIGKLLHLLTPD